MPVCKYANMQVCKYASMQVCKYAHMQVCTYMQVCKYVKRSCTMKNYPEDLIKRNKTDDSDSILG